MPSRRNQLNTKQFELLKLILKFRFVSAELVARHRGLSRAAVNHALAILLDQKLIGRKHNNTYKIAGKSAAYYLMPDAVRLLKSRLSLNETFVHAMYNNKNVSEPFTDSYLTVMAAYLALRIAYPDTFNVFTPSESGNFPNLPTPRPNLYLSRKELSKTKTNKYFLDIFSDSRLFIYKKRVQLYIDHLETGDWGKGSYPTVLLVCPDVRTEIRVLKYTEPLLEDFDIYVTTIKALLNSNQANQAIWSDGVEPDDLIAL